MKRIPVFENFELDTESYTKEKKLFQDKNLKVLFCDYKFTSYCLRLCSYENDLGESKYNIDYDHKVYHPKEEVANVQQVVLDVELAEYETELASGNIFESIDTNEEEKDQSDLTYEQTMVEGASEKKHNLGAKRNLNNQQGNVEEQQVETIRKYVKLWDIEVQSTKDHRMDLLPRAKLNLYTLHRDYINAYIDNFPETTVIFFLFYEAEEVQSSYSVYQENSKLKVVLVNMAPKISNDQRSTAHLLLVDLFHNKNVKVDFSRLSEKEKQYFEYIIKRINSLEETMISLQQLKEQYKEQQKTHQEQYKEQQKAYQELKNQFEEQSKRLELLEESNKKSKMQKSEKGKIMK